MTIEPKHRGNYGQYYTWLTVTISVLVLVTSGAGILIKHTYAKESTSWALQAIGQDMANLAAIPILLVSGFYASTNKEVLSKGLIVWIGVLLFLNYAFVIYAFDVHYNSLFLVYVSILGLSFYTLLGRLTNINFHRPESYFSEGKSKVARAVAVFLMLVAGLFCFQWLSEDIPSVVTGKIPTGIREIGLPTNPVHVLDLGLFLPGIFLTGIALYMKRTLGYVFAAPFLVFSALTGAGILFSNALSRMNGISMSYIPDTIVGSVVIVSVILGWLFLNNKIISFN